MIHGTTSPPLVRTVVSSLELSNTHNVAVSSPHPYPQRLTTSSIHKSPPGYVIGSQVKVPCGDLARDTRALSNLIQSTTYCTENGEPIRVNLSILEASFNPIRVAEAVVSIFMHGIRVRVPQTKFTVTVYYRDVLQVETLMESKTLVLHTMVCQSHRQYVLQCLEGRTLPFLHGILSANVNVREIPQTLLTDPLYVQAHTHLLNSASLQQESGLTIDKRMLDDGNRIRGEGVVAEELRAAWNQQQSPIIVHPHAKLTEVPIANNFRFSSSPPQHREEVGTSVVMSPPPPRWLLQRDLFAISNNESLLHSIGGSSSIVKIDDYVRSLPKSSPQQFVFDAVPPKVPARTPTVVNTWSSKEVPAPDNTIVQCRDDVAARGEGLLMMPHATISEVKKEATTSADSESEEKKAPILKLDQETVLRTRDVILSAIAGANENRHLSDRFGGRSLNVANQQGLPENGSSINIGPPLRKKILLAPPPDDLPPDDNASYHHKSTSSVMHRNDSQLLPIHRSGEPMQPSDGPSSQLLLLQPSMEPLLQPSMELLPTQSTPASRYVPIRQSSDEIGGGASLLNRRVAAPFTRSKQQSTAVVASNNNNHRPADEAKKVCSIRSSFSRNNRNGGGFFGGKMKKF